MRKFASCEGCERKRTGGERERDQPIPKGRFRTLVSAYLCDDCWQEAQAVGQRDSRDILDEPISSHVEDEDAW